MRRREYIALGTTLASGGVAAITGRSLGARGGQETGGTTTGQPTTTGQETETGQETTTTPERPEGVYVQPFIESMSMQGTAQAGDYKVALMYTIPHLFWTVTGTDLSRHAVEESDSVHLMAIVWDPDTGTVLPNVGLSVEITQGEELVSEEVIYPMLSQRMGFHYGANFALPGDGTYGVNLSVSGMDIRRTGAFEGQFTDSASMSIDLTFNEQTRSQVSIRELDQAYEPSAAVRPMEMESIPIGYAPTREQLPGTVAGTATSDDAKLVVTQLASGEAGSLTDGQPYLAVSARTPYNRLVIPMMAMEATVTRGGETLYEGRLQRTLDSDLGYHYGVGVESLQSGDEVTLRFPVPPQVGRHEGYETAFLQMSEVSVTI